MALILAVITTGSRVSRNGYGQEVPPRGKSLRERLTEGRQNSSVREAVAAAEAPPADDLLDLRLRIAWGGGTSRAWQGIVRMDDGTVGDVVNLGREADDPGSLDVTESAIQIIQPSAGGFAGLDVTVRGPKQAELTIELAPRDQPTSVRTMKVKLVDLTTRPNVVDLDDQRNRCHVSRAPGDRLRVKIARENLVFAPHEEVMCEIEPHALGLDVGTTLRCRVVLTPARGDDELWKHETEIRIGEDGRVAPIGPLSIPLPENEGAYDVRVAVFTKRLADSLTLSRAKPLFQRTVQLVSVARTRPATDATSWRVVAEIDPALSHFADDEGGGKWTDWLKRMPSLKFNSGFSKGPLGNGKAERREHGGRKLVSLAAQGWIAYPLPVARTDEPHVLEVEYPSDWKQTLGISIIEPNAAGRVIPLGLDSGVDVPEPERGATTRWQRHRLVFWPRTKTPLVLLTNRRDDNQAIFGKISVQAGPARLPAWTPPDSVASANVADARMVAAFFDRPMFPENFGAGEALDIDGEGTWDDWQTFYLGGRRLVEYLKYAGYNAAVVSVACEGSALYPSRLLEPTPKYDSGLFFLHGQDPLRKDVVELLFRLFDREGLKLIPAVQFASPLPELERQRRRGGDTQGWEWIGADGQTWLSQYQTNRGLAPHYNVLHPRVQEAMLRVVDELGERYGAHASFGGLALQLGPDSFAQLPGGAWGFDDVTVARFSKATGLEIPGEGAERFAARARFLLGEGRARWLAWRCEMLTDFYGKVSRRITQRQSQSLLYLATADLLTSAAIQQQLRPSLPRRPDAADVLLNVGLDPRRLEAEPHVVLLRPHRVSPIISLAAQGSNIEWNRSTDVDRLFSQSRPTGAQWYHEPLSLELPSFDSVSPFGAEQTHTWLAAHVAPGGDLNRRRLIHSMAVSDPAFVLDGGWLLAMGEEDSARSVCNIYRQLPATGFVTVATKSENGGQPLTVRLCVQDDVAYLYVVNDSPWPAGAEIDLQGPVDRRARLIGSTEPPVIEKLTSGARWRIQLAPYDLQALVMPASSVKVLEWRVAIDAEVTRRLALRVNDVRTRANELRTPKPLAALVNPGFEQTSRDAVVHWLHARGAGISAAIDATEAHGGQNSLHLRSDKEVAWVRSEPFATPTTGRLAVWVWLKVRDVSRQPALRLAIEGRLDGKTYYRFATVGAGKMAPLQDQWTQYWFQIDDLPANGLTDLRVGFDLMGAGEVWIDDVQLFDLWFYDNERDELIKQIGQADFHANIGLVVDCERFLHGYWPRFLQQHVVVEPRVTQSPSVQRPATTTNPAPASPEKPAEKTGWRDRVNGFWSKKNR